MKMKNAPIMETDITLLLPIASLKLPRAKAISEGMYSALTR
ncbi:MAG: hypothetical protein QXO80_02270 [Thermosphaera sp.]